MTDEIYDGLIQKLQLSRGSLLRRGPPTKKYDLAKNYAYYYYYYYYYLLFLLCLVPTTFKKIKKNEILPIFEG